MSTYIYYDFGSILDNSDVSEEFCLALVRNCSEYQALVEVTSFQNGRPAVMYLRNGDPGYPGEPAEIEMSEDDEGLTDKALREMVRDLPLELMLSKTFSEDLNAAREEIHSYTVKQLDICYETLLEQCLEVDDNY